MRMGGIAGLAAASLGHGHPVRATGDLGRHPARRIRLSLSRGLWFEKDASRPELSDAAAGGRWLPFEHKGPPHLG